jgi:hypothetical protein
MADKRKSNDPKEKPAKKPAAKSPDDEVAGKAYDGRLMRRLLTYLRPYKLQTALSAISIIFKAASDVMGPTWSRSPSTPTCPTRRRPSSPGSPTTSAPAP